MFNLMRTGLMVSAVAAVAVFAGGTAEAASAPACDTLVPDVTNDVTNTSHCYALIGTDGNVSNNIAEFNATNFHGFNDWVDLGKVDPVGNSANFEIKDNVEALLKGTWEVFSNAMTNQYKTFALVFKAGQDQNTDPASQVGYVISASSGDWMSPLYKKDVIPLSARQISHVSLYARDLCDPLIDICGPPVGEVPVPAGLPLMLTALGAVGIMARRKKLQ